MSLNDSIVQALESILELVVPHSIDLKDVAKHMMGYDRREAIKTIIEKAKADPTMTRVRLFLIYSKLDEVNKNGGLLE